jgi:hypothetical protein
MEAESTDVDYLIIGAGAVGMAFADTLLSETNCTMAIADRRHRPGGHWNDAYPFVRLHQPSYYYGVNSRSLGSGAVDAQGWNEGYAELASGAEVLAYFDGVMRQVLLPSGRVTYWPMSEFEGDDTIVSRLSGERRKVSFRKLVDAAYLSPAIPATTPPPFGVDAGVTCVTPGQLPASTRPGAQYVVIGAGKTGIDACLWLLENGTSPDRICWIMPRDSWLYPREVIQPGARGLAGLVSYFAEELESLASADSIDDLFARLESKGLVLRLDPAVRPTMHHCATVARKELAALRRISGIVRGGRVKRLEPGRIVLDREVISTEPDAIHVNCTARAFEYAASPPRPIFEGRRITPQFVRNCAPTFSAAFVAHVEATRGADEEKNALCPVVPPPTDPVGWLRVMLADVPNGAGWFADPEIASWLETSRLNLLSGLAQALQTDSGLAAGMERYQRFAEAALINAERLLRTSAATAS